jgi:hypothetical protein
MINKITDNLLEKPQLFFKIHFNPSFGSEDRPIKLRKKQFPREDAVIHLFSMG